MTKNNHIKIGDLGTIDTRENLYPDELDNSPYEISSAYLSPEMHFHLHNPAVAVTTKTDIYKLKWFFNKIYFFEYFVFINVNRSAGITIYELITLKRPFHSLREILNEKEIEISDQLLGNNIEWFKSVLTK